MTDAAPAPPPPPRLPWGRAWVAVAVLAVLTGVLVALLPYDTTPVEGGADLRCERPITGAVGDDGRVALDDTAPDATVTVACPDSARERLALSAAVAAAGLVGLGLTVRRHRARRAAGA